MSRRAQKEVHVGKGKGGASGGGRGASQGVRGSDGMSGGRAGSRSGATPNGHGVGMMDVSRLGKPLAS